MFRSPPEMLRKYGIRPKKSWSQCFLHDPHVVRQIVEASDLSDEDLVIEIGAGLGVLTGLLASRARKVIAIERDRDLVKVLNKEFANEPIVEICEQNALTFEYKVDDKRVKVVGNLPYNIAGPLLFRLLDFRQNISVATLMIQKEMAERIVAKPGTKIYGVPSVVCQLHAEVKICLRVGRGAFFPAPRVDSAVLQIKMKDEDSLGKGEEGFRDVVHAAFGQRRKTLFRALCSKYPKELVESAILKAGLDGSSRAEVLAPKDFLRLAKGICQQ